MNKTETVIDNQNTSAVSTISQDIFAAQLSRTLVTSMPCDTLAEKKAVYNALQNPAESLRDHINTKMKIQHVIVQPCMINGEDGKPQERIRTILIDDKGAAYGCASTGIYNALCMLTQFFGPLPWSAPVEVRIKAINRDKNQILTLEAV